MRKLVLEGDCLGQQAFPCEEGAIFPMGCPLTMKTSVAEEIFIGKQTF